MLILCMKFSMVWHLIWLVFIFRRPIFVQSVNYMTRDHYCSIWTSNLEIALASYIFVHLLASTTNNSRTSSDLSFLQDKTCSRSHDHNVGGHSSSISHLFVYGQWTTWSPVSCMTSSVHSTRISTARSAAAASSMETSENFVDVTRCWVSRSRTPISLWWSATWLGFSARFWIWSLSSTVPYSF